MLDIADKLQEPRASWCLVRRAVKSDQFRRKFLNATNQRGETPLIMAAKACDARLVSLILQLGKQKMKEVKLPHQLQNGQARFRTIRSDLLRQDSRKYDALMYSCEMGDNSTLSVLLHHKTDAFNWGFNKLCERCLAVAATACQPHSLNMLLHHLASTKGIAPLPSLCWSALRAAILVGHSLTIALLLDYMRIFADKHVAKKNRKEKRKKHILSDQLRLIRISSLLYFPKLQNLVSLPLLSLTLLPLTDLYPLYICYFVHMPVFQAVKKIFLFSISCLMI